MRKINLLFVTSFISLIGFSQNVSLDNFTKQNQMRYDELSKSVRKLHIDACKTSQIKVKVSIDSVGKTVKSEILTGTLNQTLDSIIIATINNFEGKWIPLMEEGKRIGFSMIFPFYLSNVYSKNLNSTQRNTFSKTVTHGVHYDYRKNCEDNDFYYSKGIEEFKKEKYKLAKYNFLNALKANPNDLDSQYNLGMSYLKIKKIEKACECFNKGAMYGDKSAIQQLKLNCNK